MDRQRHANTREEQERLFPIADRKGKEGKSTMSHSCPLCAEEALVERCPNYRPEAEGSWSEEDAQVPTDPNEDSSRFFHSGSH
jgi:hypothetical protein